MAIHEKGSAKSGYMTAAARDAKNKYMREWRKRNPERVRNTQARYWEKKACAER